MRLDALLGTRVCVAGSVFQRRSRIPVASLSIPPGLAKKESLGNSAIALVCGGVQTDSFRISIWFRCSPCLMQFAPICLYKCLFSRPRTLLQYCIISATFSLLFPLKVFGPTLRPIAVIVNMKTSLLRVAVGVLVPSRIFSNPFHVAVVIDTQFERQDTLRTHSEGKATYTAKLPQVNLGCEIHQADQQVFS